MAIPEHCEKCQTKDTCRALHGSLEKRVAGHAGELTQLWQEVKRPTWIQLWIFSILTGIIGMESTYILMRLL